MIPVPSGVRVWLAVGRTDMRKGMNGLALQVQQALGRDPHAGDLYVFRGARGDLLKILWHDGIGMSLYAKRLERGRVRGAKPRAAADFLLAPTRGGTIQAGRDRSGRPRRSVSDRAEAACLKAAGRKCRTKAPDR